MAAATVPEYRTLMPALEPAFRPLTRTSGGSGNNSTSASLTQSAGRPSTAQPRNCCVVVVNFLDQQRGQQGNRMADGALFRGRGDDRYLAEFLQLGSQRPQSGSINSVVVGQQDPHAASPFRRPRSIGPLYGWPLPTQTGRLLWRTGGVIIERCRKECGRKKKSTRPRYCINGVS